MDFFDQLRIFSGRVFEAHGITERTSPWFYNEFEPNGVILHYTGGNSYLGATRWFMRRRYQSKASAHFVVGYDWTDKDRELAGDLPLIRGLPAIVVQCVPLEKSAWHAGSKSVNKTHFGIEIVNPGMAKKNWSPGRVKVLGHAWGRYPVGQLETVRDLMIQMRDRFPKICQETILPHSAVQQSKKDPGPLFPLTFMRNAVENPFDADYFRRIVRIQQGGPLRGARSVVQTWSFLRGYSDGENRLKQVENDLMKVKGVCEPTTARLGLLLLGYPVFLQEVDSERTERAVKTFQRMMRLGVDGVVGPRTAMALRNRLQSHGWLQARWFPEK